MSIEKKNYVVIHLGTKGLEAEQIMKERKKIVEEFKKVGETLVVIIEDRSSETTFIESL